MRHFLEYVLVRAGIAVVDRLSYGAACRTGRALGRLWWHIDGRRRRVARENIRRSGIETDPDRGNLLGRRAAEHLGLLVVESLKSGELLDGEAWKEHVRLEISPDVQAALDDPNQGMILVSGHFGNWEIAGQMVSRFKPVKGITRPMNNPRVDRLIQDRKPRYSFETIPKYDADAKRFLSVLDNGEILALLTDQHARAGGMMVEFFGHPAATYTTAAMLHLVTRAPLCFAACRRLAPMQFEIRTSELIEHHPTGDKRRDVLTILETINGYLEAAIRTAPDQYVWCHRRWRDTT